MNVNFFCSTTLAVALLVTGGAVVAGPATPPATSPVTPLYKVVDTIAVGGEARWDYLFADSQAKRLYVSHGTQTEVIDTQTNKIIGTIANTQGVHGVAIAQDLGIGFTSDGKSDSVSVFDLNGFNVTATINVGKNPDALVYAPADRKLVVFNGRSSDVSIIDVKSLSVVATIPVGGKPEFAAVGEDGLVYFNIEDTAELASISLKTNKLVIRKSIKPCEEPTGLARDDQHHLFSVCGNQLMVVTSYSGEQLAKAPIGKGSDGVVFMDGYAFSANGADGTITVVGLVNGQFHTVATVPTALGARTIAADPATHRLYLPTADFKPANGAERRQGIPDTFRVLVLQAQ